MVVQFASRLLSFMVPESALNSGDSKTRALVEAERKVRLSRNFRFLRITGLASAVMVTFVGLFSEPSMRILIWTSIFLLFMVGLAIERRQRRTLKRGAHEATEGISRRGTIGLMATSVIWASLPVLIFPVAGPGLLLFVGCLVSGNIALNSLYLYLAPRHAIASVLILAAGCLLGLIGRGGPVDIGLAVMLALYTCAIIFAVRQIASAYNQSLVKRFELERSKELFRILFRDFEDTSSDWMWSMDQYGRINHISPQFLEHERMAGYSLEPTAIYRSLKDPSLPEEERDSGGMPPALYNALKNRLPFRDIAAAVKLGKEWRYWRLSGRPVFDSTQNYIGMRGTCSDITDAFVNQQQLQYLALNDPMTGLANRTSFERELEASIQGVLETNAEFALLTIDVDKFKMLNDTLGLEVGDDVLKEVGRRLKGAAPDGACVARFGGDEFCILIPAKKGQGDQCAIEAAESFKTVLSEPFRIRTNLVDVDCSIGIAVAPRDGVDQRTIRRNADLALYRSKIEAGPSYCMFAPEMDAVARKTQELEYELRTALKRGEFELNYQPLADGKSGEIVGYEALLRWNSHKFGRVPPDEFIRIAERSGMIVSIGEWVLRQACIDAAQWPDNISVAINLSPHQLSGFSLLAILPRVLGESGLPAGRLELEITETALESDPDHIVHILRCIREMGIMIALDDFGTGYSSLSHLVRFPFDKLKIDRSFVSQAMVSSEAMTIVRAIVSLAQNLNVKITAEGVETEEQRSMLADLGIDEMQGYLIARPLPLDELGYEHAAAQARLGATG